jgi:hypothetical protein
MSRRKQRARRGPPAALADALAAIGPEPGYDGVHTVEDAATVAKARVAWQQRRAEVTAAHRKRSRVTDVEAMQERHSPTVEIAVDDGAGKRRTRTNYTRVRQSEAWRHNRLSAMERQAETEMLKAWQARTGGGGTIRSALRPRLASGGYHESVESSTLESAWLEMRREARRQKIKMAVVVEVLTEPKTLGEIDRDHRQQSGTAYSFYVRALALWCVVRGWVRRTDSRGRIVRTVEKSA